jgi:hypothetical protein
MNPSHSRLRADTSCWYAVALVLLERETTTGDQVREICRDAREAYVKAASARGREQFAAKHRKGWIGWIWHANGLPGPSPC